MGRLRTKHDLPMLHGNSFAPREAALDTQPDAAWPDAYLYDVYAHSRARVSIMSCQLSIMP